MAYNIDKSLIQVYTYFISLKGQTMESKNLYVPMNNLIRDKDTSWTFTSLNLPYHEIAKKGIVLWCESHLEGRWTMLGGNKFGFEDATDATMFRMQFGFGV